MDNGRDVNKEDFFTVSTESARRARRLNTLPERMQPAHGKAYCFEDYSAWISPHEMVPSPTSLTLTLTLTLALSRSHGAPSSSN